MGWGHYMHAPTFAFASPICREEARSNETTLCRMVSIRGLLLFGNVTIRSKQSQPFETKLR